MTHNTNILGRTLSVQKILVSGSEVTPDGESIDDNNTMLISPRFGGAIYENEHTMTDDLPYRFETTSTKLRGAVILISDNGVLIGDASNQRYPKSANNVISVGDVDLSTMYFKNASPGNNAKINILGVRL